MLPEAGEGKWNVTPREDLMARGVELLKQARDTFKLAGAPKTTAAVRRALKSAGGAQRAAWGKASRARWASEDATKLAGKVAR